MGLMRTCPQCGQTKPLRGGFRQDRHRKLYSPLCKDCEAKNNERVRELAEKTNLKSYIQKSWKKLCVLMDEKECDQQLYNLKKLFEDSRG